MNQTHRVMGYRWIKSTQIKHSIIREVFHRANIFIRDVYGMFRLTEVECGVPCDFSIALVLLCVIDGIAREVYPTRLVRDQEKRFKRLIRDKLYWGPKNRGWIDKAEAANLLYLEFRNPLVHELGQDRPSKTRQQGFDEPVIGKWGGIKMELRNIDRIDRLKHWNSNWPTIYEVPHGRGKRMKLCSAGLYWSVKQMLNDLVADKSAIEFATVCQEAIQTLETDA